MWGGGSGLHQGRGALCANFCSPFLDIDKVMINLKTEEFVLEMTTLQSLQQLIQWVGDFVLYLLASLPNQVKSTRMLPCPSHPCAEWHGRPSERDSPPSPAMDHGFIEVVHFFLRILGLPEGLCNEGDSSFAACEAALRDSHLLFSPTPPLGIRPRPPRSQLPA